MNLSRSKNTPHLIKKCSLQLSNSRSAALPLRKLSLRCTATEEAPVVQESEPIILTDNAQMVADIFEQFSITELAALSQLLTDKLGVEAMAGGMAMAAPAADAGAAGGDGAAEPQEQTEFTVKLESFDASAKIKLIKELRAVVDGLGMKEAKDLVESAPSVVRENVPKEIAEDAKTRLEAAGGKVSIS